MSLLRIDGFGHRYGMRRALWPLDLHLAAGESVAVLGPSGCGKSTLLQAAAGLLDVAEGRITRDAERLGIMFQQPCLLPWRNALDNIALGLKARGLGRQERHARAAAMAGRMGFKPDDLALYPASLSGGMQSRVALARALAIEPDLMLLDEPFAALDIGLRHELEQLLLDERARLGCGLLMITHDPREALRLADRLLVLGEQPGRCLLELVPAHPAALRSERDVLALDAQLRAMPAVRAAFGLPALPVNAGDEPAATAPAIAVQTFAAPAAERHEC
jgi:NitT/TauT family transport system ATP-binding protein